LELRIWTRNRLARTNTDIRTLAWLTRFRGAKWGANDQRHGATPGHVRQFSFQRNGTSGNVRRRPATRRECLLSSRSRVRVAVGAQVTVLNSAASSTLRRAAGSQTAVTVAPFPAEVFLRPPAGALDWRGASQGRLVPSAGYRFPIVICPTQAEEHGLVLRDEARAAKSARQPEPVFGLLARTWLTGVGLLLIFLA